MDRLSDYDYDLPDELIAQSPLADRAGSRLLCLNRSTGEVSHRTFRDLPSLLGDGDLLVVNDTRVTARRLLGRRSSGGSVELLVLSRTPDGVHDALAKPARRLRAGDRLEFKSGLSAEVLGRTESGGVRVRFEPNPGWEERIATVGEVPLPPYIREPLAEPERYQTVYASTGGSNAAPTAGLHFTTDLFARLEDRGVRIVRVTLNVGLDTFRPIQSESLDGHAMHGERCSIPPESAEAIASASGRIVAVGTTAVRTLESMAIAPGRVRSGELSTRLFIRPGFQFQIVDAMLTNFHLPRTTMLAMLAAFAGREAVLGAYAEAVRQKYRFLSFGDSMFIF